MILVRYIDVPNDPLFIIRIGHLSKENIEKLIEMGLNEKIDSFSVMRKLNNYPDFTEEKLRKGPIKKTEPKFKLQILMEDTIEEEGFEEKEFKEEEDD